MSYFFGYERVSTSGQDLENQRVALTKYAEAKGLSLRRVFGDVCGFPYRNRPQWEAMCKELRAGKAEGLLVFRLDRLGRNAREASFFIEQLRNEGIALVSVHESFDTGTAIGRAMLEIVLVLNQLEREGISEAAKQRVAAARLAGKRIGRPKVSAYKQKRILDLADQGLTTWAIHRATGYAVGTVAKYREPLQKTPALVGNVAEAQKPTSTRNVGL